jgi:hypothetical protein
MCCNTTIFPVELRFGSICQLSGGPCHLASQMTPQSLDPVVGRVVLSGRKLAAERELSLASLYAFSVNQTLEV